MPQLPKARVDELSAGPVFRLCCTQTCYKYARHSLVQVGQPESSHLLWTPAEHNLWWYQEGYALSQKARAPSVQATILHVPFKGSTPEC